MDCSLPGSSVHGNSQARILEWVAIAFSRGSSDPGTKPESPVSPALAGSFFYWLSHLGSSQCVFLLLYRTGVSTVGASDSVSQTDVHNSVDLGIAFSW